jgi:hypothetical protein
MKKFQDQELYDIFYQIAETKQLDKATLKSITAITKQLKRLDSSDKPFLGQEITITHQLVRSWQGDRFMWISSLLKKPLKGKIIGKRTLKNGVMEYDETGRLNVQSFKVDEYIDALLVSTDLKSKPKLVII